MNHDFSSKMLSLTVPKNFVGEPFCVSQNFWDRKTLWMRWKGGMEYHNFFSNFFCLIVPNYFVEEPFRVSLISGIERFYASEGYVTIFCRNFFSHSTEKFRREALLCFTKFLVSKKSMDERVGGNGVSQFSA